MSIALKDIRLLPLPEVNVVSVTILNILLFFLFMFIIVSVTILHTLLFLGTEPNMARSLLLLCRLFFFSRFSAFFIP